jgi:hypothetical protein
MATIAGPRPSHPRHVGTLVDVTNSRTRTPLKRSPLRHSKQGVTQPTLSLRDSYLEASVRAAQKLQALRDSSRLALLRDQDNSADPETCMAPSGYRRLSSGPYSPASHNNSIATNVSAAGQKAELTETQSGVMAGPVSL